MTPTLALGILCMLIFSGLCLFASRIAKTQPNSDSETTRKFRTLMLIGLYFGVSGVVTMSVNFMS